MRLAFFASGGGSNVGAILDAVDAGRLDAEPALVVTDRPDAGVLDRAEARGLPVAVLSPARFDGEAAFADALLGALREHDADAVALAGYLKKVPDAVVEAFRHRVLNVHPSLLPAFGGAGWYGRRVHQGVLNAGCRVSGATVHLVDGDYDTGPIVLQEAVRVEPGDTAEALAARVLAVEHRIFPAALQLLAHDRLRVEDGRVTITGPGFRAQGSVDEPPRPGQKTSEP
ncbi:phosphoribosylglycinamide formyltransferase [Rubrivirga litoralis]|uniref:Phosphoribosylglycinamide formyltransferase n=1 Tax=Rubrivirga litoralis TaxID=3075598 RepID=A0ABU3BN04_9BACT|nr:phosphoribosylglycinamide formyltransferase [Rubrivirga sp. F394]MDT0630661.1 phosphoribosylglycinamide formyltransferase [Rubrivirga sp. F394]